MIKHVRLFYHRYSIHFSYFQNSAKGGPSLKLSSNCAGGGILMAQIYPFSKGLILLLSVSPTSNRVADIQLSS